MAEIAVNEGNADTITVKGWESTIYGCYVEKEAEPVTLEGSAEDIHVTLTGPVSSFPDEGELTLSVKEVNKKTDKLAEKAVEEQAEKEECEALEPQFVYVPKLGLAPEPKLFKDSPRTEEETARKILPKLLERLQSGKIDVSCQDGSVQPQATAVFIVPWQKKKRRGKK